MRCNKIIRWSELRSPVRKEAPEDRSKMAFQLRPQQLASNLIFRHCEVPRSRQKEEEEEAWRPHSIGFSRESSEMSLPNASCGSKSAEIRGKGIRPLNPPATSVSMPTHEVWRQCDVVTWPHTKRCVRFRHQTYPKRRWGWLSDTGVDRELELLHGVQSLLRSRWSLSYSLNSAPFMEQEMLLLCPQVLATSHYPQLQYSTHHHSLFKIRFNIILPFTSSTQVVYSPSSYLLKCCKHFSSPWPFCCFHLILLDCIILIIFY
jgi:hypothetical protein